MEPLYEIIGDRAVTNILLAWAAIETRRALPYLQALCAHFKLKVPRARTEPGT